MSGNHEHGTKNAAGVLAASLGAQALGFASTLFLARLIGKDPAGLAILGTVGIYLVLVGTIQGIGELRLGSGFIHRVSRGDRPDEHMGAYLASAFLTATVSCLALAALSASVLPAIGVPPGPALWEFLLMPVLGVPTLVYLNLRTVEGKAAEGIRPQLVRTGVATTLLIPAAFLWPTAVGIGAAYLVAYSVTGVWCLWKIAGLAQRPAWTSFVSMLTFVWPLIASMMLLYLSSNMMPYVVGAYLGPGPIALYLAANGLRTTILMIAGAAVVPLFPKIGELIAKGERDRARTVSNDGIRYVTMLTAPISLLLAGLAPAVITTLYGWGFVEAWPVTVVLALTCVPAAVSQMIGNTFYAAERQKAEFVVTGVQVGVLLSAFWTVPAWGLVGAGAAMLASGIAGFCLNVALSYRFGLHVDAGSLKAALLALPLLLGLLVAHGLVQSVVFGAVGLLLYATVLAIVGVLTPHDVGRIGRTTKMPEAVLEPVSRVVRWLGSVTDRAPSERPTL